MAYNASWTILQIVSKFPSLSNSTCLCQRGRQTAQHVPWLQPNMPKIANPPDWAGKLQRWQHCGLRNVADQNQLPGTSSNQPLGAVLTALCLQMCANHLHHCFYSKNVKWLLLNLGMRKHKIVYNMHVCTVGQAIDGVTYVCEWWIYTAVCLFKHHKKLK